MQSIVLLHSRAMQCHCYVMLWYGSALPCTAQLRRTEHCTTLFIIIIDTDHILYCSAWLGSALSWHGIARHDRTGLCRGVGGWGVCSIGGRMHLCIA